MFWFLTSLCMYIKIRNKKRQYTFQRQTAKSFGIAGTVTQSAIAKVHQNEIKYSCQVQRDICRAPLIFLRNPRVPILSLARRMHIARRKRLSLREYSRKSGRRAMYAKWRGRPWRKPKLSDKFSCDAGRTTMSRGDQRGSGVTFEHVDYNCDLCRGLCPFLSLSLSLCRLLVLSCSGDYSRSHAIHSHPLILSHSLFCFFCHFATVSTEALQTMSDDRIRIGVLSWYIAELWGIHSVAED